MIDGQEVKLRYSYLDSDFQENQLHSFVIRLISVAKTFENNPFVIK